MPQNAIERRREAYFQLSSRIAQLDNAQLRHLLKANATNTSNSGWGVNQTLVFGQSKVFVKRIPVTDLEYRNALYDYGEVLRNLGYLMRLSYDSCSERDRLRIIEKYDLKEGLKPYQVSLILLENIQQIQADGDIKLDDFYVSSVLKYRSITALMQNFFADMVDNPRKDTEFPEVELRYLLKKTKFLP